MARKTRNPGKRKGFFARAFGNGPDAVEDAPKRERRTSGGSSGKSGESAEGKAQREKREAVEKEFDALIPRIEALDPFKHSRDMAAGLMDQLIQLHHRYALAGGDLGEDDPQMLKAEVLQAWDERLAKGSWDDPKPENKPKAESKPSRQPRTRSRANAGKDDGEDAADADRDKGRGNRTRTRRMPNLRNL